MYAIPVYYSQQLVAPDQGASPSAHKPAAVVGDWLRLDLPVEVVAPNAVSEAQLSLAHDPAFVSDVLALRRSNGFGNCSAAVARTLPFTAGAMLAAARAALDNGRVAVAPVSGFHHAGWEHAHGYCTFNGLMVTAAVLRAEGLVTRIGILDFDQHLGDGTEDIVERIGAGWVRHYTAGARWLHAHQSRDFLRAVPEIVASMKDCDLILYQAGADPHVNDPLGGFLTTRELEQRDRTVFETCRLLELPVAWNLAGGYQRTRDGGIEPVLHIHRNTLKASAAVYVERDVRWAGLDPALPLVKADSTLH